MFLQAPRITLIVKTSQVTEDCSGVLPSMNPEPELQTVSSKGHPQLKASHLVHCADI